MVVWCRAFCSAGGTFCWTKLATTDFSSAVLTSANVTDVAGLNSDGITWVIKDDFLDTQKGHFGIYV